jgi:hypothetical protein
MSSVTRSLRIVNPVHDVRAAISRGAANIEVKLILSQKLNIARQALSSAFSRARAPRKKSIITGVTHVISSGARNLGFSTRDFGDELHRRRSGSK